MFFLPQYSSKSVLYSLNLKNMKLSLFILLILISSFSNAQIDLIAAYNSTDIGRNVNLTVHKEIKKYSVLLGVKYQIGRIIQNNQGELFRKTFYPQNFKEAIGFNIGWQRNFKFEKLKLDPFFFYEFQFTNSHTRNDIIVPAAYDIYGNVLYNRFTEFFGPTIALEHNLGIGFMFNVYKKLYLYQKIGFGAVTFHNVDEQVWGHDDHLHWEFGHILNAGILYRFEKRIRK